MTQIWDFIVRGCGVAGIIFLFTACSEQQESADEKTVDESRFAKVQLVADLDEPMEIAITPKGDVVIAERKGGLKFFDQEHHRVSLIHQFDVFSGLEDGLLGVALDPGFEANHFIYFFYSPAGDREIQRMSRFKLDGAQLDTLSEKVLLEIPTQRKECCHSAGSLAFGPDGNLYIAVGDNTNPHNPGYYNSIDERKGREYWDAQRTAANTNDLRGKILRIHPEPDGTYTIPPGNLFDRGDSLARAEIYAMGCRNPYRISVDPNRGWLFWGDVGQNTVDNPSRGPISFDEWNVARKPGFFGWPYFAGPNAPYADYDFATQEIGPFFDPAKPVNNSVNNTGRTILPPAQGAMIWYSYDQSRDFEHLGTGGKSPIAGPVFYFRQPEHGRATGDYVGLPAYYDGKFFIAEWLRDWINVVTLTDDGGVERIEPFMPGSKFSHPIELEIGPDGALYVLEYGVNWFSKNKDAALYRIEYIRGNRPPAVEMQADPVAGAEPLRVNFSAQGTFDPDSGDRLSYQWFFDGDEVQSEEISASHTFREKGIYQAKLIVRDNHGSQTTITREIRVGNAPPDIVLRVEGNRSFYWDKIPVRYSVTVRDREDGTLGDGGIAPDAVSVTLTYTTMGTDLALVESEEVFTSTAPGWLLMAESDCRACHAIRDRSVGPSYVDIAERYPNNRSNITALADKVIAGGSGAWGENVMSAHPQLTREEAEAMVAFILSLADDAPTERLPLRGSFVPDEHLKDNSSGDYVFTVSYRDKPVANVGYNTARERIVLRPPVVHAGAASTVQSAVHSTRGMTFNRDGAWLLFEDIDLTGVKAIIARTASHMAGGRISLRIDSPDGAEIASVEIPKDERQPTQTDDGGIEELLRDHTMVVSPREGFRDIFAVYNKPEQGRRDTLSALILRSLEFRPDTSGLP